MPGGILLQQQEIKLERLVLENFFHCVLGGTDLLTLYESILLPLRMKQTKISPVSRLKNRFLSRMDQCDASFASGSWSLATLQQSQAGNLAPRMPVLYKALAVRYHLSSCPRCSCAWLDLTKQHRLHASHPPVLLPTSFPCAKTLPLLWHKA